MAEACFAGIMETSHLSLCRCSTTVSAPAFQAGNVGSIPITCSPTWQGRKCVIIRTFSRSRTVTSPCERLEVADILGKCTKIGGLGCQYNRPMEELTFLILSIVQQMMSYLIGKRARFYFVFCEFKYHLINLFFGFVVELADTAV